MRHTRTLSNRHSSTSHFFSTPSFRSQSFSNIPSGHPKSSFTFRWLQCRSPKFSINLLGKGTVNCAIKRSISLSTASGHSNSSHWRLRERYVTRDSFFLMFRNNANEFTFVRASVLYLFRKRGTTKGTETMKIVKHGNVYVG